MINKKRWNDIIKKLHKSNSLKDEDKETLEMMVNSKDVTDNELAIEISSKFLKGILVEGLNDKQEEAFRRITSFLVHSESPAFVLSGAAGTGKTYMLSRVIDYIKIVNPNGKISITAPTNKAVRVAKDSNSFGGGNKKFIEFIDTENGLTYETVHKLLKLKKVVDDEGRESFVGTISKSQTPDYLIVDEASMVNKSLYERIMTLKDYCKIIFVGDNAQIPPVNESESIVFKLAEEEGMDYFTLTEPMRQADGSPVLKMALKVRESMNDFEPDKDIEDEVGERGEIRILDIKEDKVEIKKLLQKYFESKEFQKDSNYVKILAWTNSVVNSMNNTVRRIIYGSHPEEFELGERIYTTRPSFVEKEYKGNRYFKVDIPTSTDLRILDIKKGTVAIKEAGYREEFKSLILTVEVEGYEVNSIKHLNIIDESEVDRLKSLLKSLHARAKSLKQSDAWINYYNARDCYFSDVKYSYASTVHVSQGSTYQNIFLVIGDINKNKKKIERNRIKYTGISRAKEKAFIIK